MAAVTASSRLVLPSGTSDAISAFTLPNAAPSLVIHDPPPFGQHVCRYLGWVPERFLSGLPAPLQERLVVTGDARQNAVMRKQLAAIPLGSVDSPWSKTLESFARPAAKQLQTSLGVVQAFAYTAGVLEAAGRVRGPIPA